MSCSCCSQLSKWCANFCCLWLKKDEKLHHASIEYSSVPSLDPSIPNASPQSSAVRGRGTIRHTFVQHGSQFSIHPQVGRLLSQDGTVTTQPAGSFNPQLSDLAQNSQDTDQPSLTTNGTAIIQFVLHHDVMQSKLRVHLQCAANLPRVYDRNGFLQCDPFVTMHLEPDRGDKLRSKVVEGTCHPTFNETFLFGGFSVSDIQYQVLVFQIYNGAHNQVIGEASLPLADVELFGTVVQMLIPTNGMEVS